MIKGKTILVRLSAEELALITARAARSGKKLSTFMREASTGEIQGESRVITVPPLEPKRASTFILSAKIPAVVGTRAAAAPFSDEDLEDPTFLDYSEGQ